MILRTIFDIEPFTEKISYDNKLFFIGSCFASEIGSKLCGSKFRVMINPFGTVYNPVSVCNTLDIIISGRAFTEKDLYRKGNLYLSFYHHTEFTSADPATLLERINSSVQQARAFLREAEFLFVTFGSARVFRLKENGMVVSNCHKLPQANFDYQLLSVEDIYEIWSSLFDKLSGFNGRLKTIFTISPVRYLKDGAHGNQVSKSVLFLATEKLLKHPSRPGYFPAYEILMDDLRDYRFYADDMVHPSEFAIEYIFNAFRDAFFDSQTTEYYKVVMEIVKAAGHRLISPQYEALSQFAETTLEKISSVEKKIPGIDFSTEKKYFTSLLK